jgi:hypothetical protein
MSRESISTTGTIIRETEKAFLILFESEEVWVPKSVLINPEDIPSSGTVDLEVARWWADKEGIS